MKQIFKAFPEVYTQLLDIWEASVRATHHFLAEENIQHYKKSLMDEYFDQINLYYLSIDQQIAGFIGLEADYIQMLFIDPAYFGKGLGTMLVQFAFEEHNVQLVDVNEHNPGAIQFYQRMGFETIDRSPFDPSGNPFPILHMRRRRIATSHID